MFYGQVLHKQKGVGWGKTVSLVCALLIIATAVWINLPNPSYDKTFVTREKEYQKVQALVLSRTLANMYEGNGKCLLVHSPGMRNMDKVAETFKEGFAGKVTDVRAVPIKEMESDDMMHEEDMTENTAEDFNAILDANSDCDVIIFMVSLPHQYEEYSKIKIFSLIEDENERDNLIKDPKVTYPLAVGIYNGYIGNFDFLLEFGLIHAMTIYKPNPTHDELPVPEDTMEAFNKRYLIITQEKLPELRLSFPTLFPKIKEDKEK
jgi:hypothetical protein